MSLVTQQMVPSNPQLEPYMQLQKYLLLLAIVVSTVTYAAGFNPPGGTWQQSSGRGYLLGGGDDKGYLAGEPIMRATHYYRYLAFFYCNTLAFASSMVVVILILFLAKWPKVENPVRLAGPANPSQQPADSSATSTSQPNEVESSGGGQHNQEGSCKQRKSQEYGLKALVIGLRVAMAFGLLGLMGAYAAGTSQDEVTARHDWVLVVVFFLVVVVHMVLWHKDQPGGDAPSANGTNIVNQTAPIPNADDTNSVNQTALAPNTDGTNNVNQTAPAPITDGTNSVNQTAPAPITDGTNSVNHINQTAQVNDKSHRKVLMLLTTFTTSITYISGLSMPGGFWDSSREGHTAGDPIFQENHPYRLRAFFFCNTTAFSMSLIIIVLLMENNKLKIPLWCNYEMRYLYVCITISLLGLMGAYAVGSSREADNTFYVASSLAAVFLAFIIAFLVKNKDRSRANNPESGASETPPGRQHETTDERSRANDPESGASETPPGCQHETAEERLEQDKKRDLARARSLVVLLATLVATVTYQAGLVPPGGVWQDNRDGRMVGEPILLAINPKRYRVFFYCNSMAFVVSLVVIMSTKYDPLLEHTGLKVTMMLNLFGLMGAYAAGSCRDISTSMNVIALAGVVLVYVVIHIIFFTLDKSNHETKKDDVHKRRKMLLLLAVLGATLTYQAGLTPPGGFQQSGHQSGDPVLLHNYPRRYNIFFYSNSVSFMASIALIILLVNPIMYRPAIRSYGLHVCMVAGLFGLVGAYAAGSTQHLHTSIYIFALVAVVLLIIVTLLLVIYRCIVNHQPIGNHQPIVNHQPNQPIGNQGPDDKVNIQPMIDEHAKQKQLMLLGVLAASVTYQAGLNPPGGVWQDNNYGHAAGDPVMHDNHRHRYTAFFYSNSASFVLSIAVIILLLPKPLHKGWLFRAMDVIMLLNLLSLLGAYATGSTTEWETSGHVIALLVPALFCVAVQVLPLLMKRFAVHVLPPLKKWFSVQVLPLLMNWFCPGQPTEAPGSAPGPARAAT